MKVVIFALVALFSITSVLGAKKCYSCSPGSKLGCGDPFTGNKTYEIDCSKTPLPGGFSDANIQAFKAPGFPIKDLEFECMKVTISGNMTIRGCMYKVDGLDVCKIGESLIDSDDFECDTCSDDLCNSATTYYTSFFMVTSAFVAKMFL